MRSLHWKMQIKGVWGTPPTSIFATQKVFLYRQKHCLHCSTPIGMAKSVMRPFDVRHANSDLKKAGLYAQGVRSEYSNRHGTYQYILETNCLTLKKAGFFVFVVNAMLIHDFRDNTNIEEIRRLMAQSTTGGQFIRFRKFT